MFLSPNTVLTLGLQLVGIEHTEQTSNRTLVKLFRQHYGSNPLDVAEIWFDLCHTTISAAAIGTKEQTMKGFTFYMIALYYLWLYPKNSGVIVSRFGICERYARGEAVWNWIKRIAALRAKKIVWTKSLDHPNSAIFAVTVDGTDFRTWEPKHPTLPVDRAQFSHKFNHGAVKYEIAISVFTSKCVWINGPFPGGTHDRTIFRQGLKDKIARGKLAIADRGYQTSEPNERKKLSLPSGTDSRHLAKFKSRARCRHESFNGRIKKFKIMDDTFRHGHQCHVHAFEAVCVILQYQMDNGSELFAV